jgi:DNA polymerase-1
MIDHACVNCRGCPSERKDCVTRHVSSAEMAIVFEFPTQEAVTKDDLLAGKYGGATDLLRKTAASKGLDLEDVYLCTAVNCRPNVKKEAMLKNAMLACRERLVKELKEAGVKKVLCLGTIGYSALMSAERNLPITKNRGRWKQAYGMDVLATFNPAMVVASPDWFRDFDRDLEKFVTTDGAGPTPNVEVWSPETLKEAREAFEFIKASPYVSLDVETTGLSPINNKITALGFGCYVTEEGGVSVVFDEALLEKTAVWRLIASVVNGGLEVVMHNGKFDLQFLRAAFEARKIKYAPRAVHDTMLLHYVQDERPMGKFKSHVLEILAMVYFDAPDYGINMKKFLEAWPTMPELERRKARSDLHVYLGLDCYYTARLFPVLWNEAMQEDEKLLDLYEDLLLPGSIALADVEYHGVLLDKDFYEEAAIDLAKQSTTILKRLQRKTKVKDFNPNSPPQVKEYVYETLGLPFGEKALALALQGKRKSAAEASRKATTFTARRGKQREGPTAKAVLKKLARHFPEHKKVLEDIIQYRNLTKNAGTYVKGMLDRIDEDGRLRGNFNLHGTATGRLSSDNPNLQNIPESSHTGIEVRNGFVAPRGHVLIEADYSQLELRIAAHLAEDEEFKQVFIDDRDVHQEVTWALFHKTKDEATKYERYMAKCMNFGVMYQRGAGSLANGPEMDYIEESGGTRWSEKEVKAFFDKMLRAWPRFEEWITEQQEFVYENGFVTTPLGRKRRMPLIPTWDAGAAGRQAVNTPIQGTASDFTLSALIRIHARLPRGAAIVSTVHDSILIECKRELVNKVLRIVKEEMEERTPLPSEVPFKSDADIAPKWGQMAKYEWDEVLEELALKEEALSG